MAVYRSNDHYLFTILTQDSTGSIGVNSEPEREPEPPRNELSNVSAELLKLAMSDDDFKFKKARKRRGSMTLHRDQSNVSGLSRADSSDMNDNQVLMCSKAILLCMLSH